MDNRTNFFCAIKYCNAETKVKTSLLVPSLKFWENSMIFYTFILICYILGMKTNDKIKKTSHKYYFSAQSVNLCLNVFSHFCDVYSRFHYIYISNKSLATKFSEVSSFQMLHHRRYCCNECPVPYSV